MSCNGVDPGRAVRSPSTVRSLPLAPPFVSEAAGRLASGRWERGPFSHLPEGPWEPPIAQLYSFLLRPRKFLTRGRERYGKVFTIRLPSTPPVVNFSDTAAVKDVFTGPPEALHAGKANAVLGPIVGKHSLLLLDGARHLSERRLLLPPLRGERMRAYGETIRGLTDAAMSRWRLGSVLSMQHEAQSITLDVILRTVFGVEAGAEEAELRSLLGRALRGVDNPLYMVRWAQLDLGPSSPWGRFVRLRAEVHARLQALVTRRRGEDRSQRIDILSMLLDARREDGSPMADDEIRDELMTMLIAGHETTATALSWATHELTLHPELRERVQREITDACGDDEVDPGAALPFLDAFCKETLRVHPVIPGVGRVLQSPQSIGGVDLPAGVMAGCSVWLVHHDADVWPEPERFSPERFLDRKVSPYEFFPFGGGVRRCIGEAFALYEMRIVLATLLQKLTPLPARGVVIKTVRRNITLSPSHDMPVRFVARSAARLRSLRQRGLRLPQCPLKTGSLRSDHARSPSAQSSERRHEIWPAFSRARASSSVPSTPCQIACLIFAKASGGPSASEWANCIASVINMSFGTSRFASPIFTASSPSTRSPNRIISSARPTPTSRGSRNVPPPSGISPTRTKRSWK
jgi:cytochrome P450 family 110